MAWLLTACTWPTKVPSTSASRTGSWVRPATSTGQSLSTSWCDWHPMPGTRYDNCCEARHVYDEKTPGLFKTGWHENAMMALCSKTYYCQASEGRDELSSKELQESSNADLLIYLAYRDILTIRPSGSSINRGIRIGPGGGVYTYLQERVTLFHV